MSISLLAPLLVLVMIMAPSIVTGSGEGVGAVADDGVRELLAADSVFSATSADRGFGAALDEFLADDVIVPLPGGAFARGAAAGRAALDRGVFAAGTVTWKPVRAGVSADGLQGFTFGYSTIVRADSAPVYAKYMSYWARVDGAWRVRAYKRAPAEAEAVDTTVMPPSLPESAAAFANPARQAEDGASLAAAEAAFSAEAQRIGLGAAFARFGRDDAVNMGPPNRGFIVGAAAIGAAVGAGTPTDSSPVVWAADYDVIVSAAGDLGVTFGVIRRNGAEAGAPGFAFFTIWRRANRSAPWRYIAE